LQTLVVCADRGSFAAAADELGISRVAVTKRIKNMEAVAGQPLLDRNSRGVRLTESGARLCAQARVALQHSDHLTEFVAALRGERSRSPSGVRSLLGEAAAPSDRVTRGPESQLAEVHALFEHVFEASETGLILTRVEDGLVYEVNEAFCRFVGRKRKELIGKSTVNLRIWHSLEDRERLIAEVKATGSCDRMPVRGRGPNGEVRYGETSAKLVELGGSALLVSSIVDLSEARAVQGAQRDAECWREIARFSSEVVGTASAEPAQMATDLLVGKMGHLSAAVIVLRGSALAVVAASGESVDWQQRLGDLPALNNGARALHATELEVFGAGWGGAAPIGERGMLIAVAPDDQQHDPARIETIAVILQNVLDTQPDSLAA
jgi:molybdate transport repressor ModE-like protein